MYRNRFLHIKFGSCFTEFISTNDFLVLPLWLPLWASFVGFPGGPAGKESACTAGDLGSIPGLGRSLEEGKGYPLQYSGLDNSMDCIAYGVTKSRTWLSDFHFQWFFGVLKISWASLVVQMVKHLPAMRETRVWHWVGKSSWRRKWQPIPVLLPRKSHGQRSLVGYSPWGCKESDTTERLRFHFQDFLHIVLCHLETDYFNSSLLVWILFIYMSGLTVERGHPWLVPDLRGNAFSFWPLSMMLVVGLSSVAFIMLRYIPSMPTLFGAFIINGYLILSKVFSASIEIIIWFFSSIC